MKFFTLLLLFIILIFPAAGADLTYRHVYPIMQQYLEYHIDHKNFEKELLERTSKNFCDFLDPSKIYFSEKDYKTFTDKAKYEYISIKRQLELGNCAYYVSQFNLYKKRMKERIDEIQTILDNDFKPVDIDPYQKLGKFEYCTNEVELNDRLKLILTFRMKAFEGTDEKEAKKKIISRYERFLKEINEYKESDIAGIILKSFGLALDPHTIYFSPDELEDFNISLRLSLEGIGALLRSEDGFTMIEKLIQGGPAKRSGKLKENDKIMGVGQDAENIVDVFDMNINDVVKMIRGKKGTKVFLKIMRTQNVDKPQHFMVELVRDTIQLLEQVAKSKVHEINGYKIGVIDLPSFYQDFDAHKSGGDYRSASKDVNEEILKLKKENVDGIILDLRGNGGGSLEEAVKVAGLFIKSGIVVSVKSTVSDREDLWDNDVEEAFSGPMAVLVDKTSASASEIVAGTLKDYGRALIVGDSHTFGKGSVQTFFPLSNSLGALKVTISQYYTASGNSTQEKGVKSDVVVPSYTEEMDIGEKFYDYPLKWDSIPPAIDSGGIISTLMDIVGKKEKVNKGISLVAPLIQKKSDERVKKNPEFAEILDVELRKKKAKEREEEAKINSKTEKDDEDEENKKDPVLDETLNIIADLIGMKNKAYPENAGSKN